MNRVYTSSTRIYFLPKDPHWTFIWWSVDAGRMEDARVSLGAGAGEARFTLRIHDVTGVAFDGGNGLGFFDVDAAVAVDHWYLYVPVSGRSYCAEIGLKAADGRFASLGWSAPLDLPHAGPAPAET